MYTVFGRYQLLQTVGMCLCGDVEYGVYIIFRDF